MCVYVYTTQLSQQVYLICQYEFLGVYSIRLCSNILYATRIHRTYVRLFSVYIFMWKGNNFCTLIFPLNVIFRFFFSFLLDSYRATNTKKQVYVPKTPPCALCLCSYFIIIFPLYIVTLSTSSLFRLSFTYSSRLAIEQNKVKHTF